MDLIRRTRDKIHVPQPQVSFFPKAVHIMPQNDESTLVELKAVESTVGLPVQLKD